MTFALMLSALGATMIGCGVSHGGGANISESTGTVGLALDVASGVSVATAVYSVTGPNNYSKSGTIDVSQSSTLRVTLAGIPAGPGYAVAISASSADGTPCSGSSASFSVVAGQTTPVEVHLHCHQPSRLGSVTATGDVNICPLVDGIGANPADVQVGRTIALTGVAHDSDAKPSSLTFAWSASAGTLSDPAAQSPTFTCRRPGLATVTLTVSDGDPDPSCASTGTTQVNCSPIATPSMLSVAYDHACGVLLDGRAVCWGNAGTYQGGGTVPGSIVPATIHASAAFIDSRALPKGLRTSWKVVSAGYNFTCAITAEGDAYCWGSNNVAALTNPGTPAPVDMSQLPPGTKWSQLSNGPGATSVCGITSDGAGYCFGANTNGAVGNSSVSGPQARPVPIETSGLPSGTRWSMLSTGWSHTCGITTAGAAFCWGNDASGKLGNGPSLTADQARPSPVDCSTLPTGTTWAAISVGDLHTCAVTTDGKGYCWGSNDNGRLGNGDAKKVSQDHPVLVSTAALPPGSGWTQLSAGSRHTCGVATDGTPYCWGTGVSGPLGNGSTTDSLSPVAVDTQLLSRGTTWTTVQVGDLYTCGLTAEATMYCWGSDSQGRLGDGAAIASSMTPQNPVTTMIGMVGVSTWFLTGAMRDPTNPTLSFGLIPAGTTFDDFLIKVQSSNEAVASAANVTVSGTGADRVASIDPAGVGQAILTFTVQDSLGHQNAFSIDYAASGLAADPSGRYHIGLSDASTAIDVGDGYMLIGDDEVNVINLYKQDESGYPVKSWVFTDAQMIGSSERDIEAAARVGNKIVWVSSQGNGRDGTTKEYRRVLFATTITGRGANVDLQFSGRYGGGSGSKKVQAPLGLRQDLLNWDHANGHGLGADFLGLTAASQSGVLPNAPNGFNIEGLEFAADGTTGYLGFRAPTISSNGTASALIVPVTNILDLVNGIPAQQSGLARFGTPIFLDLAGRSIREMRRNDVGEYLISAGPPDNPTVGVNDTWALYAWDGDRTHGPKLNRLLPDPDLRTGGAWEAILSVPTPITSGAAIRLIADSGDTLFYGSTSLSEFSKSYSQLVTLH